MQIAISASNTGGAWDNAKKYIEVNVSIYFLGLLDPGQTEARYILMILGDNNRLVLRSMPGLLVLKGPMHTRQP